MYLWIIPPPSPKCMIFPFLCVWFRTGTVIRNAWRNCWRRTCCWRSLRNKAWMNRLTLAGNWSNCPRTMRSMKVSPLHCSHTVVQFENCLAPCLHHVFWSIRSHVDHCKYKCKTSWAGPPSTTSRGSHLIGSNYLMQKHLWEARKSRYILIPGLNTGL